MTSFNFSEFVSVLSSVSGHKNADLYDHIKKDQRIVLSDTGEIIEIYISKSLLSKLIYKGEPYEVCPYMIYRMELIRDLYVDPSLAMLKGIYFESKCIGATVSKNVLDSLPKTKKGKPYIDEERIDQAVDRFKRVVRDYGMIVNSDLVQLYAIRDVSDLYNQGEDVKVYIEGTVDFISPVHIPNGFNADICIVDLKLTKDVDVCKSFYKGTNYTQTPWGCPEEMDFSEATLYNKLFGFPFMYLVFDYKKDKPYFKAIPVAVDTLSNDPELKRKAIDRHTELNQTIRWAVHQILYWKRSGWQKEPSFDSCKKCPVLDCDKRFKSTRPI